MKMKRHYTNSIAESKFHLQKKMQEHPIFLTKKNSDE